MRIGHPGGVIECDTGVEKGGIVRAALGRTARILMEGYVHVPRSVFE